METVRLRAINIKDTENIVRWRNSTSVKKNLFSQDELKPEQHIFYYENVVKAGKCAQFIIVVDKNGNSEDIGTVFIKNLDYKNNSGEYGIFIGEETARGKGYAKAATELILEYGFETLHLHRIFLTVMSDNLPAIATYEKCGFFKEGLMRDEYLRSDGYVDIILMAMLEKDWDKRKKHENILKTNNTR